MEGKSLALGALLNEVEHFLQKKRKVPVGIAINKKTLTEEELTERMHQVLDTADSVTFYTATLQEHAIELVKGSHEATAALVQLIEEVKGSLVQDEQGTQWENLTIELENFFLYWRKIAIAIPEGLDSVIVEGKSVLVVIEGLLEMCQNLVDSVEKGEFSSVVQVLDEGIVPALRQLDQTVDDLQGLLTK